MSLERSKQYLLYALRDNQNSVIALSGEWGTGKSFLWREIHSYSQEQGPALPVAVYISLFGVRTLHQLKLKAVQCALPKVKNLPDITEMANSIFQEVKGLVRDKFKWVAAFDDLALLAIPRLLAGRLLVLDDIERKHPDLGIDEILGFIDEMSVQHGARFLLILNDDKLTDRSQWSVLREKVIDQEIKLLTTPKDAFEIAVKLTPSKYAEVIRKAVQICEISNIRILRKIIRTVNLMVADRTLGHL